MVYTPDKPPLAETSEQLRARIPGWGADLDPRVRPSVPMMQFNDDLTGVQRQLPERQLEKWPRERSMEHEMLTPVFGTSCPPKGLSGVMRRYAYRRHSEAKAAHWLILLVADRVDAWESHARSLLTLRPDNPLTQTGVGSERSHHGISSRLRSDRADLTHQVLDPLIIVGPWVVAAGAALSGARALVKALIRSSSP